MSKYIFIILGAVLFIASFYFEGMVSNQAGGSIVWVFRGLGIWFVALPIIIFLGRHLKHKRDEKKKSFFLKKGIKATATLLSAQRTGIFLNKVPQIMFEFRINSEGKKEFTTMAKKYIRFVDLSEISEGMKIPAYIHPEQNDKIFVMWEEVGIGSAF